MASKNWSDVVDRCWKDERGPSSPILLWAFTLNMFGTRYCRSCRFAESLPLSYITPVAFQLSSTLHLLILFYMYVFYIKKINQSSKCCFCELGVVMCNGVCVSRCIRWFDGQSDIRANFIYIIESILNFNIQGWVAFQTTCLCCPFVSPRENLILKSSKIFLSKFSWEFKC